LACRFNSYLSHQYGRVVKMVYTLESER
jgi:hypothetical protein